MCPKDADRMANSVDPDQIEVHTLCPDLSVWKFRIITLFIALSEACLRSYYKETTFVNIVCHLSLFNKFTDFVNILTNPKYLHATYFVSTYPTTFSWLYSN